MNRKSCMLWVVAALAAGCTLILVSRVSSAAAAAPAKIEAQKAQVLTKDGLKFRDLNKNGTLDRYEDWRLTVEQRVTDLVSKMTVEEKTGLMIHSSLSGFTGPNGEVLGMLAAGGRGGPGRGGAPGDPTNRAFQGLVVTDWLRNMPWGVEKLSEKDRQKTIVLAGVDQIGGDNDPKNILASAKDGSIPMAVIDLSARRILRPMFQMGLFENPYVDPENAKNTVASDRFLEAGYAAQVKSTVLVKNANNVLPMAAGKKIYVEGIGREAAARYGTMVDDPKGADLAILRVASPASTYPYGGAFAPGGGGRGGAAAPVGPPPAPTYGVTLAYGNAANWNVLESIRKVAASGTPTIVIVNMDKPVILTEFIDSVAAVFGAFGAADPAILDIVFGKAAPSGRLPFDLPSDMPSVMAQAADVPFDMDDPLFKFGFGLSYSRTYAGRNRGYGK